MAFISFIREKFDFTGDNIVVQGSDWYRVLTVRNSSGAALDMSEWAGTPPKCDFRNNNIPDGGVTTDMPQPTCSWLNGGSGGEIQVYISNGDSSAASVFEGVFSIEITHSSAQIAEVYYGNWEMTKETTL